MSKAEFIGLPTGSAIGINFAALFTGALIAASVGNISGLFIALFAVFALATTLLVNPRGIFLTVATVPLLFVGAVVTTGYLLARDPIAGGGASSKAAQLMVLYPLIELFPWLLAVTLLAVALGIGRVQLIKRQNKAVARKEAVERSRTQRANARTSAQGRRARERAAGSAKTVSVEELVRREGASKSKRPSRRLRDDLYSD